MISSSEGRERHVIGAPRVRHHRYAMSRITFPIHTRKIITFLTTSSKLP